MALGNSERSGKGNRRGFPEDSELVNSPFLRRSGNIDIDSHVQPIDLCTSVVLTVYEVPSSLTAIDKKELSEKYNILPSEIRRSPCDYTVFIIVKHPPESQYLGNRLSIVVCPKIGSKCSVVATTYLNILMTTIVNSMYQAAAAALKLGLKTGLGFIRIGKKKETN